MSEILEQNDNVESSGMNLYQKLAKVRAMSDIVKKDKKGYNYSYSDITAILAKVTAGMKKYGVSLIPAIKEGTSNVAQNIIFNTKFDKTGTAYEQKATEMLYTAEMTFTWVNDDNPTETIVVPWFVTGSQADPSQAFGSGLTYCTRYFLCNYFQIAQDNDVDAYRSKQKDAEESESKAILKSVIERIDMHIKRFFVDHPEKKDEVKKFLAKYAKDSNYFAIKDVAVASKLLKDLTNEYQVTEE